jgi:hypothetical protein
LRLSHIIYCFISLKPASTVFPPNCHSNSRFGVTKSLWESRSMSTLTRLKFFHSLRREKKLLSNRLFSILALFKIFVPQLRKAQNEPQDSTKCSTSRHKKTLTTTTQLIIRAGRAALAAKNTCLTISSYQKKVSNYFHLATTCCRTFTWLDKSMPVKLTGFSMADC